MHRLAFRISSGARRGVSLALALCLVSSLSACLVSTEPMDLGQKAQPLEPGLYVSFKNDGSPDEAFVVEKGEDGAYRHDDFYLALYESGLGPDVYFAAYTDRDRALIQYGFAIAKDGVIVTPPVVCGDAPDAALKQHGVSKNSGPDGGCLLTAPAQARAVLTAVWNNLAEDRERLRFVRQSTLQR